MKRYAVFGAGNVGFGVAEKLAVDAEIYIFDIKKPDYLADLIEKNDNVSFIKVNAIDEVSVETAISSVRQRSVDAMICTVGISSNKTAFEDMETFRRTININYFGNIIPIKVFVRNKILKKPGKIILLASTSGHFAGISTDAYASSKWMLVNACNSIRAELKEQGIALDLINPRTIKNIRSDEFKSNKGIEVSTVVNTILEAIKENTSKDYFIPRRYCSFHVIERLTPWMFDAAKHLPPHVVRKRKYIKEINTALITGASSGLGRELVRLYAAVCKKIYVTARSIDELQKLKMEIEGSGCEIVPIQVDFSKPDAPEIVMKKIEDEIDLLINNAGHHVQGSLLDVELDVMKSTLEVNFFAPVNLIVLSKPHHIIVNILSTSAVSGRRNLGVYSSTKAGLWCFSKALRRTEGNIINVIDVIPATFKSSLSEKGDNVGNVVNSGIRKFSSARDGLTAEMVAWIVKSGIDHKVDYIYIPKLKARMYIALEALSPKIFKKIFQ